MIEIDKNQPNTEKWIKNPTENNQNELNSILTKIDLKSTKIKKNRLSINKTWPFSRKSTMNSTTPWSIDKNRLQSCKYQNFDHTLLKTCLKSATNSPEIKSKGLAQIDKRLSKIRPNQPKSSANWQKRGSNEIQIQQNRTKNNKIWHTRQKRNPNMIEN